MNMNKKLIRLTESDLHNIVKESVNRVLNEIGDTPKGQFALGAVFARNPLQRQDASDMAEKHRNNKRDWSNLSFFNAASAQRHGYDRLKDFWEKEFHKYSRELGDMTKSFNQGLNYKDRSSRT